MYIDTNDPKFVPEHFTICDYYGNEICFCWTNNRFAIFPYDGKQVAPASVRTAPAPIKGIKSFNGRIFITCIPEGIYKFSRKEEIVCFSPSGVAIGSIFYKILVFKDKQLCLKNKQNTTSQLLLQLSDNEAAESNTLLTYTLNRNTTEAKLYEILSDQNPSTESICMVIYGRKLFKLLDNNLYLVYTSIYPLSNILPIQNNSKIAGLLLLNNTETVIIVNSKDGTLVFEKVYLGTKVQAICAGLSQHIQNVIWIVYSNEHKICYAKKRLFTDSVHRVQVQDKSLSCLQCYNSETILGLTQGKQLLKFSVQIVEKTVSLEDDTCFNLQKSMLTESEQLMKKISDATQELQALNQILLDARDKLSRINLYAYNRTVQVCPKMTVHRFTNDAFLSIEFGDVFPRISRVICSLTVNNGTVFSMKKVVGCETKTSIRLPGKIDKVSNIHVDLVTLINEGKPWCLIRDCVRDPPVNEKKKKTRTKLDKVSFINTKIAALRNFIAEGSKDMNKLSEIKNNIRRELRDYCA